MKMEQTLGLKNNYMHIRIKSETRDEYQYKNYKKGMDYVYDIECDIYKLKNV